MNFDVSGLEKIILRHPENNVRAWKYSSTLSLIAQAEPCVLFPGNHINRVAVQASNLSTGEIEAGGTGT